MHLPAGPGLVTRLTAPWEDGHTGCLTPRTLAADTRGPLGPGCHSCGRTPAVTQTDTCGHMWVLGTTPLRGHHEPWRFKRAGPKSPRPAQSPAQSEEGRTRGRSHPQRAGAWHPARCLIRTARLFGLSHSSRQRPPHAASPSQGARNLIRDQAGPRNPANAFHICLVWESLAPCVKTPGETRSGND